MAISCLYLIDMGGHYISSWNELFFQKQQSNEVHNSMDLYQSDLGESFGLNKGWLL